MNIIHSFYAVKKDNYSLNVSIPTTKGCVKVEIDGLKTKKNVTNI